MWLAVQKTDEAGQGTWTPSADNMHGMGLRKPKNCILDLDLVCLNS